jgi:tight adherence protein G
MVLLLWAGAFGVDLGFTVDGGRQAQSMADTAALDMARYINIADSNITLSATTNWLVNNKLPYVDTDNAANTTLTVAPGEWNNGTWTSPAGCETGSPPLPACNAVKVTATQKVPQIFGGGNASVSRSSVAAVTPEASFSIGSYLASLNSQQSGVLNDLLGSLGGANVTAAQYAGLANTTVTVNQLITASGGLLTPTDVMTASLPAQDWGTIWTDAVSNQVAQLNCGASPTPFPCNASGGLGGLTFSAPGLTQLCQFVSVNGSSCTNGTLSTSSLNAGLNVLQILETEAEVANGTNALSVGGALSLPLLSSANLTLTLIQPPQVAYGPTGTTATTAQVQADLQENIAGTGLINIPLSAASATATLSNVTCSNNAMFRTKISVVGQSMTANVTLAGVSIGTLTISGYSGTQSFAANAVPPTASTAQADTNPIVAGSTSPTPSYSGADGSALATTLSGVLAPVLQSLGLSVGGSETTDLATNCGAVSLVQ